MAEWQDINTAPRTGVIFGKIWHGDSYVETPVSYSKGHNGWVATDPFSSVGYIIGGQYSRKHQAYWRPMPEPK